MTQMDTDGNDFVCYHKDTGEFLDVITDTPRLESTYILQFFVSLWF